MNKQRWWLNPVLIYAVVITVVAVAVYLHGVLEHLHVMFADEQTEIFDEMRRQVGSAKSPEAAVGFLQYTVVYYPSGSKQETGSRLDKIVERARAGAIREMIQRLRELSGKDFGDDPDAWIAAFDPHLEGRSD